MPETSAISHVLDRWNTMDDDEGGEAQTTRMRR